MQNFLLAFIPIFVAVDAFGVLPIFVSLTADFKRREKLRIIRQSIGTALILAVSFIFLGKLIFLFLGISIADFMIAGGLILFCIAVMDILRPGKHHRIPPQEIGAVPIGTPLIVGPAVLTTSMIIVDEYGVTATLVSVFLNILIAAAIFLASDRIIKVLGQSGSRALSKVTALLLAAIAVMMIRKAVFQLIAG